MAFILFKNYFKIYEWIYLVSKGNFEKKISLLAKFRKIKK